MRLVDDVTGAVGGILSRAATWRAPEPLIALGLVADDRADVATRLAVSKRVAALQRRYGLDDTGQLDRATEVVATSRARALASEHTVVDGHLVLTDGRPAVGLDVTVLGKSAGDRTKIIDRATTDEHGFFSIELPETDQSIVLAVRRDGELVELNRPVDGAQAHITLNLVAPKDVIPIASEYDRLSAAVAASLGGLDGLANVVETPEQPDITLLARSTGWDARAVALLAQAHRMARVTGMDPEAHYVLLRGGYPSDAGALALISDEKIRSGWERGRGCGIGLGGPWLGPDGDGYLPALQRYRRRRKLDSIPPGAMGSVRDMIEVIPMAADERRRFASVVEAHEAGGDIWADAHTYEMSRVAIDKAKATAGLGLLTGNNIALVGVLPVMASPAELSRLVDGGYHDSETWEVAIDAAAVDHERDVIPPGYRADSAEARRRAYAADLARRVRVSFPTLVVAKQIDDDRMGLTREEHGRRAPLVDALTAMSHHGEELGTVDIRTFLDEHPDVVEGRGQEEVDALIGDLGRARRLFQMTPSDSSMKVLYELGVKSAIDVAGYTHAEWMAKHAERFASDAEADAVHRKSEQISHLLYNFFREVVDLDAQPGVFAKNGPADDHARALEAAKEGLRRRYPTIEGLFGSQGFCECEHCRSVLSPAAYLVDLLHYIDTGLGSPFVQLDARRADLKLIPLTCENTHTELPYIDVANEILEAAVVEAAPADVPNDVGVIESDVLMAEPQHLDREAYELLALAVFPVGLPFELPLATVRGFLAHADVSFAELLRLRASPGELFPADPALGYGHAFLEQVGVGRAERQVLNGSAAAATTAALYGEGNLIGFRSAGRIADRLDLEPSELTELLRTWFVNPQLASRAELPAIDVSIGDLARAFGGAGHRPLPRDERAALALKLQGVYVDIERFWNDGAYDDALVLQSDAADCDFDAVELRFANDDVQPLDAALRRLALFVRVWRRLGWTVREVDRSLEAFVDEGDLDEADVGPALEAALVYMAHVDELADKLRLRRRAREKILTFWSPIPVAGDAPLFSELFREAAVHLVDDPFWGPLGSRIPAVPADAGLLNDPDAGPNPLLAVQAALGVSGPDLELLLGRMDPPRTLAIDADPGARATFDISTLSFVYRHVVLAEGLRLTVGELVAMIDLTGIDPFTGLAAAAPVDIADDHPFSNTIRFVDTVQRVQRSGLTIADVRMIAGDHDPSGDLARDREDAALDLARALRARLAAVVADTDALDRGIDELTAVAVAVAVGSILEPDDAERFMGLWTGTGVWRASVEATEANALNVQGDFFRASWHRHQPGQPEGTNRLEVDGVLTLVRRVTLQQNVAVAFIDQIVEAQQAFVEAALGAAAAAEWYRIGLDNLRAEFLDAHVLSPLRTRLEQTAVLDELSASTAMERDVLDPLFMGDRSLRDDEGRPIIESFRAVDVGGLSAQLSPTNDLSDGPEWTVVPDADLAEGSGFNSARFDGWLQPAESGRYVVRLIVGDGPVDASFRADVGDALDPIRLDGIAGGQTVELGSFDLDSERPERLRLVALGLNDPAGMNGGSSLRVEVSGPEPGARFLPLGSVELFPATVVHAVTDALATLDKVQRIVGDLDLSARELDFAQIHPGIAADLTTLRPTGGQPTVRFAWLDRLIRYVELRDEAVGGRDDLVPVFESSTRTLELAVADVLEDVALGETADVLARALRRDRRDVRSALELFADSVVANEATGDVAIPAVSDVPSLVRVVRAVELARRLRVSVASMHGWLTSSPTWEQAEDVRNSIRAGHDHDGWLRTAKSVHDPLRQQRRDALVAHLIHRDDDIETVEDLYESLLIDPGMQSVVTTSRIQLAIASVQLFIQRCLLGLEPHVEPSKINSDHWAWMRRYRVWEANRKIWLWPENWLEPEFRDDKTHLFRELEGTLLQDEVDLDVAEGAMFTYLRGLDRIAHLEIMSVWCEEDQFMRRSNTLHVVGRTRTEPHEYFYRRYRNGTWTPWEPIPLEIEGDHVVLVRWRDRLHLMWLTFMKRADTTAMDGEALDDSLSFNATQRRFFVDVLFFRSEMANGEWSAPSMSGPHQLMPFSIVEALYDRFTTNLSLSRSIDEQGVLSVFGLVREQNVVGSNDNLPEYGNEWDSAQFRLDIRSAHEPLTFHGRPIGPTESNLGYVVSSIPYNTTRSRTNYIVEPANDGGDDTTLEVNFDSQVATPVEGGPEIAPVPGPSTLLGNLGGAPRITICDPDVELPGRPGSVVLGSLTKPFFLQDEDHAFFVEPSLSIQTIREPKDFGGTVDEPWDPDLHAKAECVPLVWPFDGGGGPPVGFPPRHDVIHRAALFRPDVGRDSIMGPDTIVLYRNAEIVRDGSPAMSVGGKVGPAGDAEIGTDKPMALRHGPHGLVAGSTRWTRRGGREA